MSAGIVVAGIMFVFAGMFFVLARWIKSSEDRDEKNATLFKAFAIIFTVAAFAMLVTGKPDLS